MKITDQFREKYYPVFVERATEILGATLRIPRTEAQDLARDFTSAFLYSNSLYFTFDIKKGEVEPFFASWVRKSILSYRRNEWQWSHFALLEENLHGVKEEFSFEFEDWYNSLLFLLKDKYWVSSRNTVSYVDVVKAVANQLYHKDKCTLTDLCKELGVTFYTAKAVVKSLREVLNEQRLQGLI